MNLVTITSLIILFGLLSLANAKCGLNQFHGKKSRYYESACNDIEQYEQCSKAENALNSYVKLVFDATQNETVFKRYDLLCDQNILCVCNPPPYTYDQDVYYCENEDLYTGCLNAKTYLSEYDSNTLIPYHVKIQKPEIRCNKSANTCSNPGDSISSASKRYLNIYLIFCPIYLVCLIPF